jgi:hypothetical protein
MCRSNVIIYQNEIKFEIYCNDKTESHHIYHRKKIESSDKHNNLGMDKVTHYTHCDFPGYIKCEKNILWLYFLWLLFLWLFFLWLLSYLSCDFLFYDFFFLWLFFRLPFMYCIYNISFIGINVRKSNISFIEISCPPMKRQTIICISDFW